MLIVGQLATSDRFFAPPPEFAAAIVASLPPGAEFRVCTTMDAFRALLPEATGIVGWPFASALLRKAPRLRFVHLLTAGVPEGLETARATVRLSSSAGTNARAVAEHALFLVLAAARGVSNAGLVAWAPEAFRPARPLASLRVLVVGYGAIGEALATLLAPLVASVTVLTRTPRSSAAHRVLGLEALADEAPVSDVVVLALPNRPETRALFGADFFAALAPEVAIVNVARGALLDETALLAFLAANLDARYLTDVAAPEPYPEDGPLRGSASVVMTPHVAGRSVDLWPALAERAVAEIALALGNSEQP